MALIDTASDIRDGEELPIGKIETFIRDTLDNITGKMTIRQFPGGHSNLTYLIDTGDRQMVLRCPPRGTKARSAHDMNREFRILSALKDVYPYCPRPIVYSDDESILGAPFYLMERICGTIIRTDFPKELKLSESDISRLFRSVLNVQYELHAIDYEKVGLKDFGKPEGYVRRQVEGWSRRYQAAITPDAPNADRVMDWLAANMPEESGVSTIIHNDFKFDNVILHPSDPFQVIGVLDWEMATIGDPLMDFGCSLGYWVEPEDPEILNTWRDCPTNVPGALTRRQMVQEYERLSGRKIHHFNFYYTFGVFRLAVIVLQIYYRYYNGQTRDHRHKSWGLRVNALIDLAHRCIAQG